MPLLNEFFFVENESRTDNSFTCQLRFDATHTIFQGHFPGQPVVPGVCSIEIVRELMGMILQKNVSLKESSNVKFLRLLTPENAPVAEMSWKEENGEIVVQATMKVEGVMAFKMQGVMVM